ncbi:MAG: hypothetical protein MZV64_69040 [Ignavibacteriales bacterium]|nr:hypothetical protein [Ignavibacteriales bacterium]
MKFNLIEINCLNIFSVIFLHGFSSNAQKNPEIFGLAGYQLNGDVTVARGELNFDDGVSYGAGIDIPVDRYMQAEISWSMANSQCQS